MNMGGIVYNVMIVGGGYDEGQDIYFIWIFDVVGNVVMIFNVDIGVLLWQVFNVSVDLNLLEMIYLILGYVVVIDRDNDGLVDYLYVMDMGGQIFWFDIYNGKLGSDFIKGQCIVDFVVLLNGDNCYFYYGVDVFEVMLGSQNFYVVVVGSGWCVNLLDQVVND